MIALVRCRKPAFGGWIDNLLEYHRSARHLAAAPDGHGGAAMRYFAADRRIVPISCSKAGRHGRAMEAAAISLRNWRETHGLFPGFESLASRQHLGSPSAPAQSLHKLSLLLYSAAFKIESG